VLAISLVEKFLPHTSLLTQSLSALSDIKMANASPMDEDPSSTVVSEKKRVIEDTRWPSTSTSTEDGELRLQDLEDALERYVI
jgi:hypothetical protein